jgi:hypothetical protein
MGCGCKGKKNNGNRMNSAHALFLNVTWTGEEQRFVGSKTQKDYGTLHSGQTFQVIRFDYNDQLMQLSEQSGG